MDEKRFLTTYEGWNALKDVRLKKNRLFDRAIQLAFDEDPGHDDPAITEVKFELLDKAYSAGLRRWVKAPGQRESDWKPVERYVQELYRRDGGRAFKQLMREAKRLAPLREETRKRIVAVALEFRALLKPLARRNATIQSFYSKYLWFHAGVTPVFDGYAMRGLRAASKLEGERRPRLRWEDVITYENFAEHAFWFTRAYSGCEVLEQSAIKEADDFLVWMGS
jgi:hypothetical protein